MEATYFVTATLRKYYTKLKKKSHTQVVFVRHSGKGKTVGMENRSVVPEVGGRMKD